jgi:hypothetical protein
MMIISLREGLDYRFPQVGRHTFPWLCNAVKTANAAPLHRKRGRNFDARA